jgi:hypothetical protein
LSGCRPQPEVQATGASAGHARPYRNLTPPHPSGGDIDYEAMPAPKTSAFRSAKELREILDAVLRAVDADPDDGPRLRSVGAPMQFEFTDLKLVLNLSPAESGRHCFRWDFRRAGAHPKLRLSMDSEFANRLLQGRENPAIAIARGRLRTKIEDVGAALSFFPAAKPLFSRYREIVDEKYPHLAVD